MRRPAPCGSDILRVDLGSDQLLGLAGHLNLEILTSTVVEGETAAMTVRRKYVLLIRIERLKGQVF